MSNCAAWVNCSDSILQKGHALLQLAVVTDAITIRYRGHTNNWREAACVDRPVPLDWFQEQGGPRKLRFAAPVQPPKHLGRGRRGPQSSAAKEASDESQPVQVMAAPASAAVAEWA